MIEDVLTIIVSTLLTYTMLVVIPDLKSEIKTLKYECKLNNL